MKGKKFLPIALLVLSVALAAVSYLVLPEVVVTQVSAGGAPSTMPKLLAIALPFLLSAGGAIYSMAAGDKKSTRFNPLLVSCLGIVVFAVMLAVNLA